MIPSSSSVSTLLSYFSLAVLAAESTTAATDEQEIFRGLEIKFLYFSNNFLENPFYFIFIILDIN
jgi:hypothetical protein